MPNPPGTLFVVATPIGNLEDLTFRGLRTLKEVDLIAAEDTRRTSNLLAHYAIRKPVVSLREHNEAIQGPRLVGRMLAGESIALVTDAGTPGISDPGAGFVAAARAAGLRVIPIPGCSAVVTALSASGVPAGSFLFAGYPPATGAARQKWFDELREERRPIVLFEAPHRIRRTLVEVKFNWPNSQIVVCRELTKMNEELVDCTNGTGAVAERGEFVIVLGATSDINPPDAADDDMARLFGLLTSNPSVEPLDRAAAFEIIALRFKLDPSVVKKRIKKATIMAKRSADSSA
jgi:16S rRNA (cytidine1402-2'-O)-methyltransferase